MMITPWQERQAALTTAQAVEPAWYSLTLGQFLEGCALALNSPYPMWLLRKFCGRYHLGDKPFAPSHPLYLMLCGNPTESLEHWEYMYQLLVELFHLLYLHKHSEKEVSEKAPLTKAS